MKLIFPLALIVAIILEIIIKKKYPKGTVTENPLTLGEKILIWILCIINPIIAGAVFYFGWKKRIPIKAKQANKISWLAFFLELIIVIILASFNIIEIPA